MNAAVPFAAALVSLLFAACDGVGEPPLPAPARIAPVGPATVSEAEGAWTVTALDGGGVEFTGAGRVDVTFGPVGGGGLVAEGTGLSVRSEESVGGRHDLSFTARAPEARVQGVRSGEVLADHVVPSMEGGGTAGTADAGPTSVHRRVVCEYGSCSEVIEYDYDRVETGTAMWAVGPSEPVAVDRVRVMVSAAEAPSATVAVRLSGFRTLTVHEVR